MTWLVWRQHRKQLLFGVAALFVLGAFFVGTGMPIHDRFEKLGLPDCLPAAMDAPVVVDTDALERDGVVTSSRDGNVRVSAHSYNSTDDVDAVLAALTRHRHLLA